MQVIVGRIWTVPEARVEGAAAQDPGLVRVRIEGLLCSLCAARAGRALSRVPGVESAAVDLEAGAALVRTRGNADPWALEESVRRAVLFMPIRRLLAWLYGQARLGQAD